MTSKNSKIGTIGWIDLTTANAAHVKEFYCKVVGWKAVEVPVDGYHDFCVGANPSNDPVAGICHAKGQNSQIPSNWLIYIVVEDLDASVQSCKENGGRVMVAPRMIGSGKMAVIADPDGNICALYEEIPPASA